MFLHGVEALVDCAAHPDSDDRQRNHRKEREAGERGIDAKHEHEREQPACNGIDEIHDRRSGNHPNCPEIIGQARHDVTGARARVVRRVERFEVREQVVPQVVLDTAAHTVHQMTHSVAHRPRDESGRDDPRGNLPGHCLIGAFAHGVDAKAE